MEENAQTPATEVIDQTFWPDAIAFLDLAGVNQITAGKAHCTAVAVCDSAGHPAQVFEQGQTAHFFYEFELQEDTTAVAGGLEFCDISGRCVHGKNTFQYGTAMPDMIQARARLRFHHVLHLELGPGNYYFSLGLATADAQIYDQYREGAVGEVTFSPTIEELCRVTNVGSFQVIVGAAAKLSHHGLVNLPGSCQYNVLPPPPLPVPDPRNVRASLRNWTANRVGRLLPFLRQTQATDPLPAAPAVIIQAAIEDIPTMFHVTHWKAGSQWIKKILEGLVPDRIIAPDPAGAQFFQWPIQPGKVYPTVYASKQQFDVVRLPANWRRFVIIRDLRDTLISAYFSLKVSHSESPYNAAFRARLQVLSLEMGLAHVMEDWLPMCARIQLSWLEAEERILRYEELLEHDVEILEPLLLGEGRLPVGPEQFREVVQTYRFERMTQGRARGEEDINAHQRKGISGDWRNYFSEPLKRMFKTRYGGILISAGYEQDMNW
jgi:hypothetical protein